MADGSPEPRRTWPNPRWNTGRQWLALFVGATIVSILIALIEHGGVSGAQFVSAVGLGFFVATGAVYGAPWFKKRARRSRLAAIWPAIILLVVVVLSFIVSRLL